MTLRELLCLNPNHTGPFLRLINVTSRFAVRDSANVRFENILRHMRHTPGHEQCAYILLELRQFDNGDGSTTVNMNEKLLQRFKDTHVTYLVPYSKGDHDGGKSVALPTAGCFWMAILLPHVYVLKGTLQISSLSYVGIMCGEQRPVVKMQWGDVAVVATHLHPDRAQRFFQIKKIRELLEEAVDEADAVILVGDMNFYDGVDDRSATLAQLEKSRERAEMMWAGFTDCVPRNTPEHRHPICWGSYELAGTFHGLGSDGAEITRMQDMVNTQHVFVAEVDIDSELRVTATPISDVRAPSSTHGEYVTEDRVLASLQDPKRTMTGHIPIALTAV